MRRRRGSSSSIEIEVAHGCLGECDVTVVRRVERAAEEAGHWTSRTSPPTSTSSPLRAPPRAAPLELSSSPGPARDAEAAVGAEDPEAAPLVAGGRRGSRRARPRRAPETVCGGHSSNSARSSSSMPAPVAHETPNTRTIRSSSTRRAAAPRRRSILFRTTACGRSRAGAVRGELAIDRGEPLGGIALGGVDHVSSSRARSRCARNSWPRPMPSLAPSIKAGDVGDRQLPRCVGRVDGAEHRGERRERIVGDLRPRVGDAWRAATTCPRSASRRTRRRRPASAAGRASSRRRETRLGKARRLTRRVAKRLLRRPGNRRARRLLPTRRPGGRRTF